MGISPGAGGIIAVSQKLDKVDASEFDIKNISNGRLPRWTHEKNERMTIIYAVHNFGILGEQLEV